MRGMFAVRFGYEPTSGWSIVYVPVLACAIITASNSGLAWAHLVETGYFSPYVAATAIISSRFCVRAGVLSAVLSALFYNFFITPPVLAFSVPGTADLTAYAAAIVAAFAVAPRSPKTALSSESPASLKSGLPFVETKKNGKNGSAQAAFWSVEPSYDWKEDDMVGREYGRIYVDLIQRDGHGAPPLAYIVNDMIRQGRVTGLEAGFSSAIEQAARRRDIHIARARSFQYDDTHQAYVD